MNAAIYLHKSKEELIRKGHPWVFPNAIGNIKGSPITGQLVHVFDSAGILLGIGAFNEHSLYRVRLLAAAFEQNEAASYASLMTYRLHQAVSLRASLDLPNSVTTAYRLFNSEGDGLSGLTIDRFNRVSVIASSAYWVEANKSLILKCIHAILPEDTLHWLSQTKSLLQDGWSEKTISTDVGSEEVLEAGIRYRVDFSNAQKTGLFLDQRENHQRLALLVKGKRVLDLYTYTGGFALHAAKAGAAHVTAVDSSSQAIALAKENAALNHLTQIDFIKADAREYVNHAAHYDVIILDPPKLIPSRQHLQRAKNYYRFLHREIFKYMRRGSLLLTCNCSAALNTHAFVELVSTQARIVGKDVRQLGVFGPASCHPVLASFPEGQYLTAVLLALV